MNHSPLLDPSDLEPANAEVPVIGAPARVSVRIRIDSPLHPVEDRCVGQVPDEVAAQISVAQRQAGAGATARSMFNAFLLSGPSSAARDIVAAAGVDVSRVNNQGLAIAIGQSLRCGLPVNALAEKCQALRLPFAIRFIVTDEGEVSWEVEVGMVVYRDDLLGALAQAIEGVASLGAVRQ